MYCRCFLQVIGTVQTVRANFVGMPVEVLLKKMTVLLMNLPDAASARKNVTYVVLVWNSVFSFISRSSPNYRSFRKRKS